MAMSRRRYTPPREWVVAGERWPGGVLADEAPPYAVKTRAVVRRLESALSASGMSARQVAIAAAIDPGTLSRLRAGEVVPDLGTIVNLEAVLRVDLWGRNEPINHAE